MYTGLKSGGLEDEAADPDTWVLDPDDTEGQAYKR